MKDIDCLNIRTDKYLIFAYINENNKKFIDNSFVTFIPENLSSLLDTKVKDHVMFYNKFSNIAGKPIRSFVNKFSFNAENYDKLCEVFTEYKQNDKTEPRVYNCLNEIFGNKNKEIEDWIRKHNNNYVYFSFYDTKYQGGTAGICFGYEPLPSFIIDGASEHTETEKIPIKVGVLNKEFKGISGIIFSLQPVNFIEDWIFTSNFAEFTPNLFTVTYNAFSKNSNNKDGFSFIKFEFVPRNGDTFYINKTEFDKCNDFFKWIINASKNKVSTEDVRNKFPPIRMRLKSIEVTNNTVRQSEKTASEFLEEIFVNLGLYDHYTGSQVLRTIENENKTAKIEFPDNTNIQYDYCDCELKAYL